MAALKKAVSKITAWSFSRLQDYRKCPAFAKYKHVDKIKEPGNAAMDRGSAIGKLVELFVKDRRGSDKAPLEIAAFAAEFLELRKRRAVTEEQWAFDRDWNEVDWFDAAAWLRVKTDIYSLNLESNTLLVVDVKTGKVREEHLEQLKLYALGAFLKFPTVAYVDVRLWYLDGGVEVPEEPKVYSREELSTLKTYWLKETKAMLADTRFAPKPSGLCQYCHFSASKGGPCEY